MKTDRELLELAAKAAGMTLTWEGHAPPYPRASPEDEPHWKPSWNPLLDDGDALRLAVKLGLEIRPSLWTIAAAGNGVWKEEPRDKNDDYAATRRAIVRAAAAIGEQM